MKLTWGQIMRIYKVTLGGSGDILWFHRQDEAEASVEGAVGIREMHIVEVPASRLGLVAWLNANYTREV